ncbi:hypothetical protein OG539_32735 [Actinacidiphila glaucinigra]|uniref:hypothetical protein n=1 Tax=Actinacidiphila glaucinigra TaxID=235986 RepID=UPI003248765E
MAINGVPHPSVVAGDDLDVPDFMKPGHTTQPATRTIVGELVPPPAFSPEADDEDDIAPGGYEYLPDRTPVLRNTSSAAMVVASRTGRVMGLTAKHFAVGFGAACYLGWRYVRGHDFEEAIGGVGKKKDWKEREEIRTKRWKVIARWTGVVSAVNVAAWWALVKYAGMTALDWSWAIAPGVETLAAGVVLTMYGRYRLENKLAPQEIAAADDIDDGEEPFPLSWCKDGRQVEECVGRALAYEGIDTRRISVLAARTWGWEVDIDLKGSTPGKVAAVADQLDTHFDVAKGGTMIEPDPQRAAHIVLRLRTSDPFADMPRPTVHAPNSLDVSDPVNMFRGMDGSRPEIVLEGTRILAIAVSGAAKSTGVLRDLAEVVTACHNAIAIEMDPIKDGLREFEGVMAVPPIRGTKACEEWLGHLVAMAEARNIVRNRLNMGDTWTPTRQHPAIFPFVDEFIYLSKPAKELFIQLLRLGKQVGIYPIAAGQDATSDSMGDAIADSFTLRIMLAARHADIPLVFGQGAIAAGWRPDRLQPAQNKDIRNDAGRAYIMGAGLDRPILYGWNEISRDQIKRAVEERAEAGRPWFDYDTLAEAKLLHLADKYAPGAEPGETGLADRLLRADDARALKIAMMLGLFDKQRTSFLPTALLVDERIAADAAELQSLLAELVPGATSARQSWEGKPQVRGWTRATVEAAANALLAPS